MKRSAVSYKNQKSIVKNSQNFMNTVKNEKLNSELVSNFQEPLVYIYPS